ncbi:hypothetical protein COEREDRAFT_12660 [Coemansia reversa NRRL 1564]|uniref:Uncharacterized protein n=1 Tax=Coemansia reversa (strain ATCC 12441 / NRRL 1564) TaxID=763665 RepID=A0A2G5B0H9_COERN|nr:hypothetical protein COEREDRAFT_12660 [Coemansia reversa NRRL 1564]|eukprot:PIA12523.1 hypothetical protein COEREDRAFT_12660 [Coemansia reversa NRRL 1564]
MGTEEQPVASTSKGKESADVLMAGNLSKYSTEVPKATQTQIIAPKASELLDAFKSNIEEFSGNAKKDKQSCTNWITKIMSWRCGALIRVFEQLVTVAVQDLLRGDAKDTFKGEMFETLDSLVSALQITFPLVIYQQQLMDLIRSGEAFKGITRYNFGYVTKQYIDDFQELLVGLTMLADAIQKMFPVEWKIINRLNEMFLVDPEMTPKPFGAMVKSKITSYSTINVQVEQPANKVVKPMPSNPSPTSLNVPKPGKTALLNLKAQINALTQADNVPLTSGNASKSGGPAKLGKEPYQAIGTTNACISIENGPKRWVTLVVVDCKQPWDLLLSNAHLKLLHIQLMTPAMVKQLKRKGRPIPEEGDTVTVDKDSTLENAVPNLPNPELTMPTNQEYTELSETVIITGESPNSEPAPELSTDLEL